MRFHVLAIPHTITRKDQSACAFTQKVLKFCTMMQARGHTIYHQGHADSVVDATEHITVTDNEVLQTAYGGYDWKKEMFRHNTGDHAHQTFQKRAIPEVGKRKQPRDFILLFWGHGHLPVSQAHPDLIAVEPGLGSFNAPCTDYRVFESQSLMNMIQGQEKIPPRWQDCVIPNYFDLRDFTFEENPDDYYMYLGRIVTSKGIQIAIDTTKSLGKKLIMAGQGDYEKVFNTTMPDHVEFVGYLEPAERAKYLSKAKAVFVPSQYNEPFGGVMVEALLCGTPVITSDWGAFAENNLHGITGYRCRTMEQFFWAAKNIENISRKTCREWAEKNFSLERVGRMYEEYFDMLLKLQNGKGFQQENPDREQLEWITRQPPQTDVTPPEPALHM